MNTGKFELMAIIIVILFPLLSYAAIIQKPLILQEMGWPDVQEYLKTNDMIIIPLGATEQHGPHLPLGTDCYESFGISGCISAQTGVIVAPVLWVGYSLYHSGFPGTLSISKETMEQVLYETVEVLIKTGFGRFMFFNYHGGNNIVQDSLIHKINHTTTATAIAIGIGHSIQKPTEGEYFDWHAGKHETSIMLYLRPDLVRMDRAQKPKITFSLKTQELMKLSKEYPELLPVLETRLGVPVETKKGGASHELSSNGVWSFSHPNTAKREIGKRAVEQMVDTAVKFINAWKKTD